MRLRIRNKIILYLIAFGIPFFVASNYAILHFLEKVAASRIEQSLIQIRSTFLSLRQQQLDLLQAKAQTITQAAYLKATLGIGGVDKETLFYLNSQVREVADKPLMLILNADGSLKIDLNDMHHPNVNFSNHPGIHTAIKGQAYQGTWNYDDHFYSIAIAPIILGDEILGLFVMGDQLDNESTRRMLEQTTGAQSFLLLAQPTDAQMVLQKRILESQKISFVDAENIRALLQAKQKLNTNGNTNSNTLIANVNLNGEASYVIATPLNGGFDHLVLCRALSSFDTGTGKLHLTLLMLGAASILFGSVLSIWIASKISNPIVALTEVAKQYGKGNLDVELALDSSDEMGDLAAAFNRMARDVKTTMLEKQNAIEKLENLTETLERRVFARTAKLKEVNKELEVLALYDQLTGLPNRTLATDRLQQSIAHAHNSQEPLIVMMMDLNGFKQVNDGLGHGVGDRVLDMVGKRLQPLLRVKDTLARLGGDEFTFILPDMDCDQAEIFAQKILVAFNPTFIVDEHTISMGTSIGIAAYPEHGDDRSLLWQHSDVAMYAAKSGKTGFKVYDPDLDPHSRDRLEMISELRAAIENRSLDLYYQPICSLQTMSFTSVEALSRWNHPNKGDISPELFISIAEETGLIHPLTMWVLEVAIGQIRQWRDEGVNLSVAVNLSMLNLSEAGLVEQVSALLNHFKVPGDTLIFELTESSIMECPHQVMTFMTSCRELGLRFAIDDFGTGYSSLSYLRKLPVQTVKIDRSFVTDISSNREDLTIVRSITDLAHNLGMSVIAVGVENEEALTLLLEHNCDCAQGYYFSKALQPQALIRLLHSFQKSVEMKAL